MKIRNQTAVMGKRALFKFFCASVVSLLVLGCSDEDAKPVNRAQMRKWIGRNLHQGMPIDSAVTVMKKAGFVCTPFSKELTKFVDVHKKLVCGVFDFIKCEREDGPPPISLRWRIILVHENGLLSLIGL